MSKSYTRVLATLSNAKAVYLYNMDMDAKFTEDLVVSGKPVTVESEDGSLQYKFTNPLTGWFCSITTDDTERMPNVLQFSNGDVAVKVSPIRTYTADELSQAKPFVGGAL